MGHKHIGTEHVFLAILLDGDALPTQMMERIGARNEVVQKLRTDADARGSRRC
jgi:hypothetical protein